MKKYDVLIVGGGAAGLAAAIYTCRKKLKTGIISVDTGGQAMLTNDIENYPGFDKISGPELMSKFQTQASTFGVEFINERVEKISGGNRSFKINGKYLAKAVIISSGKTARKVGVPGEGKFLGRGVSTCATCDAGFYQDKNVVVVGGGNSALEAVELLSKFASKVYLIHRRKGFRGDEITLDKIKKLKNVEIMTNTILKEIRGRESVESIIINDKELKIDGVFIEIGYKLDTDWLKGFVKMNKLGEIKIDDRCNTSHKGIFAAGDVSTVPYKQVVISAGEGAKAGLEAYKYISGEETVIDWK